MYIIEYKFKRIIFFLLALFFIFLSTIFSENCYSGQKNRLRPNYKLKILKKSNKTHKTIKKRYNKKKLKKHNQTSNHYKQNNHHLNTKQSKKKCILEKTKKYLSISNKKNKKSNIKEKEINVDLRKYKTSGNDQLEMASKIKALTIKKFSNVSEKNKPTRNKNNARKYRKQAKKKIENLTKKNEKYKWLKEYMKKSDVEHPHELQLGGPDANFHLLHRSVNRSSGSQISNQLKKNEYGTKVRVKVKE